jgi:hypothetical protein
MGGTRGWRSGPSSLIGKESDKLTPIWLGSFRCWAGPGASGWSFGASAQDDRSCHRCVRWPQPKVSPELEPRTRVDVAAGTKRLRISWLLGGGDREAIHGNADVAMPHDRPEFFHGHLWRQKPVQIDAGYRAGRTLSPVRPRTYVETSGCMAGGMRRRPRVDSVR